MQVIDTYYNGLALWQKSVTSSSSSPANHQNIQPSSKSWRILQKKARVQPWEHKWEIVTTVKATCSNMIHIRIGRLVLASFNVGGEGGENKRTQTQPLSLIHQHTHTHQTIKVQSVWYNNVTRDSFLPQKDKSYMNTTQTKTQFK